MEGRKMKSVMIDEQVDELLIEISKKLRKTQCEIVERAMLFYSKNQYPEDAVEVQKLLESV